MHWDSLIVVLFLSSFQYFSRGDLEFSAEVETKCDDKVDLNLHELSAMIDDKNIQLFDVREPEELKETGYIPMAINIPVDEVGDAFKLSDEKFEKKYHVKKPSKDDKNIVLCCLTGVRAKTALDDLLHLGYTKAKRYPGGWKEWEKHLKDDAQCKVEL